MHPVQLYDFLFMQLFYSFSAGIKSIQLTWRMRDIVYAGNEERKLKIHYDRVPTCVDGSSFKWLVCDNEERMVVEHHIITQRFMPYNKCAAWTTLKYSLNVNVDK